MRDVSLEQQEAFTERLMRLVRDARDEWADKVDALRDEFYSPQGVRKHGLHLRSLDDVDAIYEWINAISWKAERRDKKDNESSHYATAYYSSQRIVFWGKTIATNKSDSFLYDMILHEMGHLFTGHFLGTFGHDNHWRAVGRIVGYVQVGGTYDGRRLGRMVKSSAQWVHVEHREKVEQVAAEREVLEPVYGDKGYVGIGTVGRGQSTHAFVRIENAPEGDHMDGWRPVCNIGVRHGVADSRAFVSRISNDAMIVEDLWFDVTCQVCHARKHKVDNGRIVG